MSVQYNRIRNSEIKLQDVKAQNIPFADDAMVMNRNTPTGDPPAPKRLKKKLCSPTPTDDRLVSFEFMPLALCEIAGNPLLNDVRLASVVGQIVDGLLYLEQNGLEHSSLTCSNVLVDLFGNVKIWNQEHIKLSAGRYQHVEALGEIIMYLAHGQARDDGIVGLDEPQRFPLAFDFLCATQTASKLSTVTENALLKLSWHKSRLAGLICFTNTCVGLGYRFPATAAGEMGSVDSWKSSCY